MSNYEQKELTPAGKLTMLAIAVFVIGSFVLVYFKFKDLSAESNEIHEQVIDEYLSLIQSEQYETAYNLLGKSFKEDVSLTDFKEAHKKRFLKLGALVKWKSIKTYDESNLFSGEHRKGLKYILDFSGEDSAFVLYWVDLNVEPYRIVETLGTTGLSTQLSAGIW